MRLHDAAAAAAAIASSAATRLHHVNVDRLLFLYQASSGEYQATLHLLLSPR
jgi:hypothetical protein